jgi:hypothetical protein
VNYDTSVLRPGTVATFVLAALLACAVAAPADAAAKKGKVHVCVEKRGKDKGAMRLSKSKRCHKGEKSLTLNKRGPAGQRGPEGPAGQGASPDALAALQQALADQAAQIAALQSQLTAACAQLSAVTTQVDALGTAIGGIGLNGALTALGGALNIPALPAALPAFACP